MSIGPKETFKLRVRCRECDYEETKEVSTERINLAVAKMTAVNEVALRHRQHPDLNHFLVQEI